MEETIELFCLLLLFLKPSTEINNHLPSTVRVIWGFDVALKHLGYYTFLLFDAANSNNLIPKKSFKVILCILHTSSEST